MALSKKLWTDWVPLVVSICAVIFTAAQWYESREQRLLANDAVVTFNIDTDPSEWKLGISIKNVGPGIATIHSVKFYVDRKLIGDPDDALDQAKLDSNRNHGVSLAVDEPVGPQETIPLIDYHARNKEERDRATDFFEKHMDVAVNYCTASGRCTDVCTQDKGCANLNKPNINDFVTKM